MSNLVADDIEKTEVEVGGDTEADSAPERSLARIRLRTKVQVRVRCTNCGRQDVIPEASIPDEGLDKECDECGEVYFLKKPPRQAASPSERARDSGDGNGTDKTDKAPRPSAIRILGSTAELRRLDGDSTKARQPSGLHPSKSASEAEARVTASADADQPARRSPSSDGQARIGTARSVIEEDVAFAASADLGVGPSRERPRSALPESYGESAPSVRVNLVDAIQPDRRKAPRTVVDLSVRYLGAENYVFQYAKNLSRGGAFIAGAQDLDVGQQASIEIDLPGMGVFKIRGEVQHILGLDQATESGVEPGAGFNILERPDGFQEALSSYMIRLWKRRGVGVLSTVDRLGRVLAAAGFEVLQVSTPAEAAAAFASATRPMIALLVDEDQVQSFADPLEDTAESGLVVGVPNPGGLDKVLRELDERAASSGSCSPIST